MRNLASILFLILALTANQGAANTYSFATAAGSTDSAGEAVSARATFSVSVGTLVVTLINRESNTISVGQNISSLFFTVDNGGAILSLSPTDLVGSSGTQVTIGSGGVVSGSTTVSPVTHWTAGSTAGQSYLNDLAGGGQPVHTIIGPASSSGNYTTVNASIAGNGPHNPFIQNQATFTFNAPGLLATSTVTGVTVGFGTAAGNTLKMVPEPGSLFLASIGALAIWRRRVRPPVSGLPR